MTSRGRRSTPVPWQLWHGSVILVPRPAQSGQGELNEKKPWFSSSTPRPPQVGHVTGVDPGSAADEAGLRGATRQVAVGNYLIPWGGDFIIAVDGREVTNRRVLNQALSLKQGGDTVKLTIIRGGQKMDVAVTLKSAAVRL